MKQQGKMIVKWLLWAMVIIAILYILFLIILNIKIVNEAQNSILYENMQVGTDMEVTGTPKDNFVKDILPIIGFPVIHSHKDFPRINLKIGDMYIGILEESQLLRVDGIYLFVPESKIESIIEYLQ